MCDTYKIDFSFQVQVYWSESPKAKFVKQGEVDQVCLSDNDHFYFYFLHLSSDNDHFYWHHNIQVSFTAKLTVSDKKVKWSFQDQVSTTIRPYQDHNPYNWTLSHLDITVVTVYDLVQQSAFL